ncbi:elongation factor TFIIS domain 2-containing protein [Piromyces finnis]|uniref:Elongation factor TFIIS domain 2-containing protein n=1 Tax=Piromyces finnis TaxID=1754191 RepID=A0A1Y1UQT7_9FUNG|nr:elongation factor TFIIS domain 2-containing protein [Piromyces finnis]|eukprot:ORX40349.1 elongation factor TFIIS domain 2-containing protein [Piromyces finnis]
MPSLESETVKDDLKQLYQIKATTSLLQQTQIGKVVNHVKKNPNVTDDIIKLSRKIIYNWKQDIEEENKTSSHDSVSKDSVNNAKATKPESKAKPEPPKRTSVTDGIRLVSTGNKARAGCANMLYKALALYEGSTSQIENEVYKLFQSVDSKYKTKIMSLYLNLKDKSNPQLREKIINDDISASEFCQMSPTEMASEQKQEELKIKI